MKPLRLLAIETTSPRLSLALGDQERVMATFRSPLQWRHAESLFDGLRKILAKAKWKPSQLTGIAVAVGPGSFTGIRIGLAAARALGQTLRIPVVGVSSLEIMAQGAKNSKAPERLSPEIDALSGRLYTALFERTSSGGLKRIVSESCVHSDEWTKRLSAMGGLPVQRFTTFPEAKDLLVLARPRLAKAKAGSYRGVLPLYVRQAAAQERRQS